MKFKPFLTAAALTVATMGFSGCSNEEKKDDANITKTTDINSTKNISKHESSDISHLVEFVKPKELTQEEKNQLKIDKRFNIISEDTKKLILDAGIDLILNNEVFIKYFIDGFLVEGKAPWDEIIADADSTWYPVMDKINKLLYPRMKEKAEEVRLFLAKNPEKLMEYYLNNKEYILKVSKEKPFKNFERINEISEIMSDEKWGKIRKYIVADGREYSYGLSGYNDSVYNDGTLTKHEKRINYLFNTNFSDDEKKKIEPLLFTDKHKILLNEDLTQEERDKIEPFLHGYYDDVIAFLNRRFIDGENHGKGGREYLKVIFDITNDILENLPKNTK